MDRFIAEKRNEIVKQRLPLKSNMDRFIADVQLELIRQNIFKIQYG